MRTNERSRDRNWLLEIAEGVELRAAVRTGDLTGDAYGNGCERDDDRTSKYRMGRERMERVAGWVEKHRNLIGAVDRKEVEGHGHDCRVRRFGFRIRGMGNPPPRDRENDRVGMGSGEVGGRGHAAAPATGLAPTPTIPLVNVVAVHRHTAGDIILFDPDAEQRLQAQDRTPRDRTRHVKEAVARAEGEMDMLVERALQVLASPEGRREVPQQTHENKNEKQNGNRNASVSGAESGANNENKAASGPENDIQTRIGIRTATGAEPNKYELTDEVIRMWNSQQPGYTGAWVDGIAGEELAEEFELTDEDPVKEEYR
jgi:hypothetical protein